MIRLITTLTIATLLFISNSFSQEISGDWYGQLDIQGMKLRINFHITEENKTYSSTMDSPDQGANGIPTDATIFSDNNLEISMKSIGAAFKGTLNATLIEGTFTQGGMEMPLTLSREKIEKEKEEVQKRPQDPTEPYGYKSEEVFFKNPKANNIKLAGTLTLPNGVKNPPVVILISGSGPQNRNEEIKAFNHRPFLVLSDYLTKNGIAVLRYDDRGVGESEGTQSNATSADFATDVEAAVTFLKTRKDVDTKKIGLMGHSEGGLIAPMVASNNKEIAFIVLLAGPGVDGGDVLISQTEKAGELSGTSSELIKFNTMIALKTFNSIKTEENIDSLKTNIKTYLETIREEYSNEITKQLTDKGIENQIKSLTSNWLRYFIKTNPDTFLSKTTCPVLAINGEKDFQVVPKQNLDGIKKSLQRANNKDVTILELEGLNHLFQTCKTGSVEEYSEIEETFSPKALQIISDWVNKRY